MAALHSLPPRKRPRVRSFLRKRVEARRVVALLPAHDEEAQIGDALASLRAQNRPPDVVVVVADNCTDRTADVAREAGAVVFVTRDNHDKKAGALNQALDALLPDLEDGDAVLVMDADSILDPTFIQSALEHLWEDVGGVGGVYTGRNGGGFVGMLQRNEYARYARDVARLGGRVLVLTGTATLFATRTLRHVIRARASGELPGDPAVYDTHVLTEDNELTLALLHLGYTVTSPPGCRLTTEVMESWSDLYRQRLRWKRGALENLRDYGLTRVTARYWGRQVWTFVGITVTAAYFATLAWSFLIVGQVELHPLWLAITAIFSLERMVTVRSRGPLQMALAGVLVVEMGFDLFLQAVHAKALVDSLIGRERRW